MKYECQDCGHVFDQTEAVTKTTCRINGRTPSDYDVCQKCNSENLNEDYKEPEQDEEEREFTAEDKKELRGEYWMEVERGN